MLQMWKARRGRKAAVALIAPFIEQSRMRLGTIPDMAWQDAYLCGFLAMLASLEAKEEAGSMSSHALALVQSETLAELSGETADVIGETICTLSMEQEGWFGAGCRDALVFHEALHQRSVIPSLVGTFQSDYPSEVELELDDLWKQFFESRISFLL
jgi:hypothetical protein